MKFSRPTRILAVCIALFSMLFTQFAMASYVCPATMTENGVQTFMAAADGYSSMVGCDGMDRTQPILCHAQATGETTKISFDKPQLPDIQPFIPVGAVSTVLEFESPITVIAVRPASPWLTRLTAPPLAIRHCCFRI